MDLPTITDDVLDQWESSAMEDLQMDQPWSVNPRAILAVVQELREHRVEAKARAALRGQEEVG